MLKAFLDTTVLRLGINDERIWVPVGKEIELKGQKIVIDSSLLASKNPNLRFLSQGNYEAFHDSLLLGMMARLAKKKQMEFYTHHEARWELFSLPIKIGRSVFDDVEIKSVADPFPYSYSKGLSDGSERQYKFLSEIKDQRFLEIQRAVGAYQGPRNPRQRNQLLDAFHILCAERSGLEFFVTMDCKLIKLWSHRNQSKSTIRVVSPSGFLGVWRGSNPIRWLALVLSASREAKSAIVNYRKLIDEIGGQ